MSSMIQRTLPEATGMSEEEAAEVWRKMPESPFRKLIQYELEKRLAIEQLAFQTIQPDKFQKQQGIVEGMQNAILILSRKDPKPQNR